jgi:hypothetical protein
MRRIFLCAVLFTSLFINAQNEPRLDKDFTADDSTALLTVASYPDSIRTPALLACQNPEVLVNTEALQKSTSESFRNAVSNYTQTEQQKFWDITRYPDLISKITNGGKKSKEELETIATAYPKTMQSTIVEYGRKHYEKLIEINKLYANSQTEFNNVVATYPKPVKDAFTKLLSTPDVLNTLSTNLHLSVILGNMYVTNPKQTKATLDSIKNEHAKQSAKDLEDWKAGLEKDPQAKQEMENAAKQFIKENATSDDVYYNPATDDVYNNSSNSNTASNNNNLNDPYYNNYNYPPNMGYPIQPYPYWFGYPWWYTFPYWYPYPFWFNLGFYWGPFGMTFWGLPSPFFMNWYLFNPYNHYYYPHFSNYALGYSGAHYGPRYERTGFNHQINSWARTNASGLPKGYLNADPQRADRIKELGKFEMDYHNNTKGLFGKNISRPDFLQNNKNYYPHISPVINQSHFNQPISYPHQQNPIRFNMDAPGTRGSGFMENMLRQSTMGRRR